MLDRLKLQYWGVLRRFLMLFVLVSSAVYLMSFFEVSGYQTRNLRCINYLIEGSLYGGQPECVQPPFIYVFGAFITFFTQEYLNLISLFFVILLSTYSILVIQKIVGSQNPRINLLISLMYVFLILPLNRNRGSDFDPETTFAIFFAVLGIYFIVKKKYLFSGIFLAFALLSKIPVLSVFVGIIVYLIFSETVKFKKNGYDVEYAKLKNLIKLVAPSIIAFYLLNRYYANFLIYTVYSHLIPSSISVFDAFLGILGLNPLNNTNLFLFYLLLIFTAAYYVTTRDKLAFAYVTSLILVAVNQYSLYSIFPNLFGIHYVVYPSIIFLILVGRVLDFLGEKKSKIPIIILILFTLIFGGFKYGDGETVHERISGMSQINKKLNSEIGKLRTLVDGGYQFIPENRGKILMDEQMFTILQSVKNNVNLIKVDITESPSNESHSIDSWFSQGLYDLKVWDGKVSKPYSNDIDLINRISDLEYEMIFISPTAWETQVYYSFEMSPNEVKSQYCSVIIPKFVEFKGFRKWSTLKFKDSNQCINLFQNVNHYYMNVSSEICGIDSWSFNSLVKDNLLYVNKDGEIYDNFITHSCKEEVDVLDMYQQIIDDNKFWKIPVLTALSLFLILSILHKPKK